MTRLSLLVVLLLAASVNAAVVLKPSGGDDTAAIQTALTTAPAGSEVHLAAGIYRATQLAIRQPVEITADPATTLNGPADRSAFVVSADNVSIRGLSIIAQGGVDYGSSTRTGETINNCTLQITGVGISAVSLANATFTGDTFKVGPNALGIYIWVGAPPDGAGAAWNAVCPAAWSNVTIDACQFLGSTTYTGQCQGIHARGDTLGPPGPDNGPGKSHNLTIRRCLFDHISRCGVEKQGGGTDDLIEDNVYRNPTLSTSRSVNDGSMAYSLAADASLRQVARRNLALGDNRIADGVGVRNGIEFAGHNGQCIDNDIEGLNQAIILQTSSDGIVTGNRIANCLQDAVPAGPQAVRGLITNNGANVALTWDINRPWPASSNTIIVRGAANAWTVDPTGHADLNGSPDTATSNVIGVFAVGTEWCQINSAGEIWTLPGANATKLFKFPAPTPLPPPAVAPRVVTITVEGGGIKVDGK